MLISITTCSIRPKFPEIAVQKRMVQTFSGILVHLSRLSFFLEIWKFLKSPVPFGISTRYELAPVPLVVKSYKIAASLSSQHYTGCKMICHSSSLFLIEDLISWKICGLVVPNFLWSVRNVCILSPEKSS